MSLLLEDIKKEQFRMNMSDGETMVSNQKSVMAALLILLVVNPEHRYKIAWNAMIGILALFTIIAIPLQLAFVCRVHGLDQALASTPSLYC